MHYYMLWFDGATTVTIKTFAIYLLNLSACAYLIMLYGICFVYKIFNQNDHNDGGVNILIPKP